jgi:hypothetical protein
MRPGSTEQFDVSACRTVRPLRDSHPVSVLTAGFRPSIVGLWRLMRAMDDVADTVDCYPFREPTERVV